MLLEHLDPQHFAAYRQRTLTPDDLLAMEDHLASCEACRRQLASVEHRGAVSRSLRTALQPDADAPAHLQYEQLAAYVDDTSDDVDCEIVEAHVELCAMCAEELQDLRAFKSSIALDGAQASRTASRPIIGHVARAVHPQAVSRSSPLTALRRLAITLVAARSGRSGVWSLVPVSAVVVLVLGLSWQFQPWRSSEDPAYRSVEPGSIASLVPAGTPLLRARPVLRWTAVEGARYRVRVFTMDLQLLEESEDLASPEYPLTADVLRRLPSGARIFWQVEASVPGSAGLVSPTFSVHVE